MPDTAKLDNKPDAPRRTESKAVRRMQLIEATITSIAEHGIGGTTMSTVTENAGLSVGIVNFHFQSKQNLFEETLMFLAREHHDQWKREFDDAGLNPVQKLSAIVAAHFHPSICTRRKLAVWFAFFGEAGRRGVYRSLLDEIDDERHDLSLDLIKEIIADGGYNAVSAQRVAMTLEGLYDGLWLNILMYPDMFTCTESQAQIMAYLASVFPKHFSLPDV